MSNPDDYGWLRIRTEEAEPHTLAPAPDIYAAILPIIIVEQADPVVSASAELVEMCELEGLVHNGVLTIGTPVRGLGVVSYRISEHPEGPDYRVLTLEGTDRDR